MKACLLIHGFTGSPYDLEPLACALRQAGYEVNVPTLAGHAQDEDLQDVCWTDWLSTAEKALKPMLDKYDEINVIGFSMGALIAAWLSTKYPVTRLALLGPAIYQINYRQLFENMSAAIKTKFQDSTSEEFKMYIEKATNTPLRSVIDFRYLVEELTQYLQKVTVPTLIIQGKKDLVVCPESAEMAYDQIKAADKKLIYLDNSPHMLCLGEDYYLVNQHVLEFLRGNL